MFKKGALLRGSVFLAVIVSAAVILKTISRGQGENMVNIAITGAWGSILPHYQHTVYGDVVLANQFESLVRGGADGEIYPGAAKAWRVSNDFRSIIFTIDSSRRFSDGTFLSAKHVKASWEDGFSADPKFSYVKSLEDIFYKVEGVENFEKTHTLSGLRVIDDSTLEVRFNRPFRSALLQLSYGRFGVSLKKGNAFLGTGPFILTEVSPVELRAAPNPFFRDSAGSKIISNFRVVAYEPLEAFEALRGGTVEGILFAQGLGAEVGQVSHSTSLRALVGMESSHAVVNVNMRAGKLFSNGRYRKALQYILIKGMKEGRLKFALNDPTFRKDAQSYLPLQAGRLSEKEEKEIVDAGQLYEQEFLNASVENPIKIIHSNRQAQSVIDFLKGLGVGVAADSGFKKWEECLEDIYKLNTADLFVGTFSVDLSDSDGLYHVLGRHGSIRLPFRQLDKIEDLLEEGRQLTDVSQFDVLYKKVGRAVLEEVPYVHLGFRASMIAYDSSKVRLTKTTLGRTSDLLTVFEPK